MTNYEIPKTAYQAVLNFKKNEIKKQKVSKTDILDYINLISSIMETA